MEIKFLYINGIWYYAVWHSFNFFINFDTLEFECYVIGKVVGILISNTCPRILRDLNVWKEMILNSPIVIKTLLSKSLDFRHNFCQKVRLCVISNLIFCGFQSTIKYLNVFFLFFIKNHSGDRGEMGTVVFSVKRAVIIFCILARPISN